jgi:hypothetical protein
MHMHDWISKLDDFLRISDREILSHAGKISHEAAVEKARAEYEIYRVRPSDEISPVERHFLEAVKEVKQLEKSSHRKGRDKRPEE